MDTTITSKLKSQEFPLVSVVIPIYNAGHYILQTIESVLSQTYPHIEVIVVNDGSTNDIRLILEPYITAQKIKYIVKENGGPSSARNMGIKISNGEFIAFLDQDDIFMPTKIEKQVAYLVDHAEVDVSYCDIWHFYDWEPEKLFVDRRSYYAGKNTFETLLLINFMNPLMIVMRKIAIDRIGMFDEDNVHCDDWEYWVRLTYNGAVFAHLGGEPLAKKRIRTGGLSYGGKIKVEEKKTMLRVFENLRLEMSPADRKKYHMGHIIFRQKFKLVLSYFVTNLSPLQWIYQWIQKKRLQSA